MTLLDAFRRPQLEQRSSVESPTVPLTSSTLLDLMTGPPVHAGVKVSEKSALGVTAVYRAVNLVAGTSASLPLHGYQGVGDGRKRLGANDAGAKLLAAPHPDLTPFELWEIVYAHLLLWGNAYLQKLYDKSGRLAELWPISPWMVKPGRASDLTKVYLINGDVDNPRGDDSILHIPGFGYDGVAGLSPISLARQGIGLALAAEEYGARLYGSGSLMSGILKTSQRLDREQADLLKARWKEKVGGLSKAHDVAVLDNGAEFQPLSIPPDDAQFIESRRFQISEIARMFGVPPHMLMDTEKSTSWGSGIEQQSIGFVVYTLRPWLTRIEQRVSRLLDPGAYARYSVEGLLRGDSAQRAAFYTSLWNIGVLSTNDIRRLEELSPVTDGDVRYRPLNMGLLGQTDTTTQPAGDPAGAAA